MIILPNGVNSDNFCSLGPLNIFYGIIDLLGLVANEPVGPAFLWVIA